MTDSRLSVYMYYEQLLKHLRGDSSKIFGGFQYPRQFEIHLPADHARPCNLRCPHCAGRFFNKDLGRWENKALALLNNLRGEIPYHIYGGAYTEPLMNPYFMAFMGMTKAHGNHFGIHTNGLLLKDLELYTGMLTELHALSTDEEDYLSVSLDAGTPEAWASTKGARSHDGFFAILDGIRSACSIRGASGRASHAIRICYLISDNSGSVENFSFITDFAKEVGVDSVRFSIPFANYNQGFEKVRKYKSSVETPKDKEYLAMLRPLLSTSKEERPYIFYTGPEFTDIDRFTFNRCAYGYYQITFGADGYVYKCSTSATPTAKQCRLGRITSDVNDFEEMIKRNQSSSWDCSKMCFSKGIRCNRMGLEINRAVDGGVS